MQVNLQQNISWKYNEDQDDTRGNWAFQRGERGALTPNTTSSTPPSSLLPRPLINRHFSDNPITVYTILSMHVQFCTLLLRNRNLELKSKIIFSHTVNRISLKLSFYDGQGSMSFCQLMNFNLFYLQFCPLVWVTNLHFHKSLNEIDFWRDAI